LLHSKGDRLKKIKILLNGFKEGMTFNPSIEFPINDAQTEI
jgi:hypothetical protein